MGEDPFSQIISLQDSPNEITRLKEENILKLLSDKLIEGGADYIALSVWAACGWTERNVYKDWIEQISPISVIDSIDKPSSHRLYVKFHINNGFSSQESNPQNIAGLLGNIKEDGLTAIIKAAIIKELPSLTANVEVSVKKQVGGFTEGNNPFRQYKSLDPRSLPRVLSEPLAWNFSYKIVVPIEYSWIAHLFLKSQSPGKVVFFCKTKKPPINELSFEEFNNAMSDMGKTEGYVSFNFKQIPSHAITRMYDISKRTKVPMEPYHYENGVIFKSDESKIFVVSEPLLGDFESFNPPHINYFPSNNHELPFISKRMYETLMEIFSEFNKENVSFLTETRNKSMLKQSGFSKRTAMEYKIR